MVAFSFKERFVPRILAGTKDQTIRLPRKRNAQAGDGVQLFHGDRFHPTRIGDAHCHMAADITLQFADDFISLKWDLAGVELLKQPLQLDVFSVRDGFDDWADMRAFWLATHGPLSLFDGRLTRWTAFRPAVP